MRSSRLLACIGLFGTLALGGCEATVEPEPAVGYTYVTSGPVDIETYPSVMYQGQPTYFYAGRWWRHDGGRWAYYREEPAALRNQRPNLQVRGRPVPHVQ